MKPLDIFIGLLLLVASSQRSESSVVEDSVESGDVADLGQAISTLSVIVEAVELNPLEEKLEAQDPEVLTKIVSSEEPTPAAETLPGDSHPPTSPQRDQDIEPEPTPPHESSGASEVIHAEVLPAVPVDLPSVEIVPSLEVDNSVPFVDILPEEIVDTVKKEPEVSVPAVVEQAVEAEKVPEKTPEVVQTMGTVAVPVVNISSQGNDSSGGEDDIPSFSEWTQQQLNKVLAEEKSASPSTSVNATVTTKPVAAQKLRQKNYAAPDCGSKIISNNPEAENAYAVLQPARDEYLLSICSSKIWFVIELCESIRAKRVEIANYELFSSSPKDFRVFISDRYPTRDWALLGQFTAADERSIQSFIVEQQFGKFVKVEVDSHYGTQHYCPISLFRVYGTSEYEVLNEDIGESQAAEPDDSGEDATEEEMLDTGTPGKESESQTNLFGSAKKVVISMVRIAAEVLVKGGTAADGKGSAVANATANGGALKSEPVRPVVVELCHTASAKWNVSDAAHGVNASLSCQWQKLRFLSKLSWLRFEGQCNETLDGCCFETRGLQFARSIWGVNVTQALCHWRLFGGSPVAAPSAVAAVATLTTGAAAVATVAATATDASHNQTVPEVAKLSTPAAEEESTTTTPKLASSTGSSSSSDISVDLNELEHLERLEHLFSDEVMAAADDIHELPVIDAASHTSNKPDAMLDPKTIPASNPASPSGGAATGPASKESVFVRLSNRIKVLERNMSLSSQYLEELSRRYKRQVDDMQKSLNRTLQILNETFHRMSDQDEKHKLSLLVLQNEMRDLKTSVHHFQAENIDLRTQIIERHLFLMMVEILLVVIVVLYCHQRQTHRQLAPPTPPTPFQTTPIRAIAARRYSDGDDDSIVDECDGGGSRRRRRSSSYAVNLQERFLNANDRYRSPNIVSLDDSSSSGCESAFSFPSNSVNRRPPSRDPSPNDVFLGHDYAGVSLRSKMKRKKKKNYVFPADLNLKLAAAAGGTATSKMRLKSDNWEWHSRAKILAAAFIKENYEAIGMRSSV